MRSLNDSTDVTRLFAPTQLGHLELRNSFVMAPMTRSRSPQSTPTAEVAEYYRRRAAGGVALLITEGVLVDHISAGHHDDVPRLDSRTAVAWNAVVDAVHREGSRMFAQLWHLGGERHDVGCTTAWTPSGVPGTGSPCPHTMSVHDIDAVVESFGRTAAQARARGFDGVEIHSAHGYLIDEFLWPETNRRTDGYGGSIANRVRFATEIVSAVRAATTPDYPISIRFSQFKERCFAAHIAESPRELEAILVPLMDAGATLFHASQRRFWEPAFEGSDLNLAGWAKKVTGLPAITVGSVGLQAGELRGCSHPEHSLAALAQRHAAGEFDLVAVGRPLLANPSFVNDVADECFDEMCDYHKDDELVWP